MKAIIKVEKEVDVKYLCVAMAVRYDEDDIPNDFPLRDGDMWNATIDIDEGRIMDWPKQSRALELSMKVCDEGTYELIDVDEVTVAREEGYVPNKLLPGEFGDYVKLEIAPDGLILNWLSNPSLEDFKGFNDGET